ncbi:MAG: hypothetical protein Q8L23_10455 [Caulobacter sp.]|nr:hypothetical protein [Caulobacter sp.]
MALLSGPALAAVLFCGEATAGAWPAEAGETLAILKYERSGADAAFEADGSRAAMPQRSDESVSLYVERGLTERLTLQASAGWTRGEDVFVSYEGRGPIELGLRYAAFRTDRSVVSLYLGAALAGEGRNAGYAAPGAGETDLEARLLAGRSAALLGRPAFVEVQLARLDRSGLPDETRLDLTLGVEPSPRWLLLAQTYAGQADDGASVAAWIKLEVSAVRRFGDWRLQAGWRQSLAGRSSPAEGGPVFALWRAF